MLFQILLYIAIGVLGILLYTTFKAREYLFKPEFDLSLMICDNKKSWIWSIAMLILLAITISILPESGEAIKTMVGLDITEEKASWLSLGFALSALTKNTIIKK
jgi:hypothetical protein